MREDPRSIPNVPGRLVDRDPQVSPERLLTDLVPPPHFASVRFATYAPDPGQPSQAAAAAADDVCRRYNLGKCPNTQGPCVTSAGVTLKHVCNYRLATGGRCLANHARHSNH